MKIKPFLIAVVFMMPSFSHGAAIKEPNVAGQFYSGDAQELSRHIDYFFDAAKDVDQSHHVEVMVSPHAGYVYSGPIAAYSFKAAAKADYKTVVVIGPSHFFRFDGVAIWPEGGFQTPLGTLAVDEDFASRLLKENPQFKDNRKVFDQEHALEVEFPFIQKTFKDARIVPILMGTPDAKLCADLAKALHKLIGERKDVLIVISSDMSHYHPYDKANTIDAGTLKAIEEGNAQKVFEGCLSGQMELCGFLPVTTALIYAQLKGLTPKVLKYANSGDTAGDKSRVVGYSSIIFYKGDAPSSNALNEAQKKELLKIARQTVEDHVKGNAVK